MTAAVLYHLRLIVHRQSLLPPVLLFLAILAFVYSGDAGPPIPAAAATSIVLMPVAAWISRLTATVESAPFAEITAVALGGRARQTAAQCLAALAAGAGLSIIAVTWARLEDPHPYPAHVLTISFGMHLAQVIAGVGIGSLLGDRVPTGVAVVALTVLTVASLVIRWLPPLSPMLRSLNEPPIPRPSLLLAVIGQAAVTGCVAATAAVIVRVRR